MCFYLNIISKQLNSRFSIGFSYYYFFKVLFSKKHLFFWLLFFLFFQNFYFSKNIDKTEPIKNLVTWVYEENSFVPSAKITERGTYSIINDYLGRPIQAFDSNDKLVWSAEYDIYGKINMLIGNKRSIPFRQLGQYEDFETELYYNRYRYYDFNTGAYISKDPIGLLGNNPNLYAYVKDSNTQIDVLGLSFWKGFSKGQLSEHYQKHVIQQDEFGDITQSEYLARAKAFGEATGDMIDEADVGNFKIKYNSETGEVFVGHTKTREIRTYYIDDGRSSDPFGDAKLSAGYK